MSARPLLPGIGEVSTRYRSPSLCNCDLSAISGRVSRLGVDRIRFRTASEEAAGITSLHVLYEI